MALAEDFTARPLSYYVTKFQRRVFRRMVEYRVLKRNVSDDLSEVGPNTLALLQLDGVLNLADFEIKDHIEKACLTGLKTEFELFFTIYTTLVVDYQLRMIEEQRKASKKMKKLLKEQRSEFFGPFVDAGLSNARQLLLESLIPSHGLGNFADLLKKCGWEVEEALNTPVDTLPEEFNGLIDTPWAQINMAFQVRHAIEHTFSKVGGDGRFLFHTGPKQGDRLRRSTWRRWWSEPPMQPSMATEAGLGATPKTGDRVLLDETDVRGTAAAMTWAASQLLTHWEEFGG